MSTFSKLSFIAVALSGVLAAPLDGTSKFHTHRPRLSARGVQLPSYHPAAVYETFGEGVEHPLAKRADTSSEDAAISFLEDKLGLGKGSFKYKTGFTGEGATHVYIKQSINGIEVANSVANVALKNNKVVAYGANFMKPKYTGPRKAKITSTQAISFAESHLDGKWNDWPTKTEYVIKDDDNAVLTHVVQIQNKDHWYEAFIDAQTGDLVNVIDFVADAAYRVVPFTKQDPTWSGFSLLTDPQDTTVSPYGWHKDSTSSYTTTRGNNVNAYHSSTSTGQTSQSASGLIFDYTWSSTTQPSTANNMEVGTVNAFYIANAYHDLFYKYGFTERAYNFQSSNFGKGGAGNDPVKMAVQASGTDNANFATPADGQSGQCNMYLWDLTSIKRDGDLSNDVITHEFTHGLTNRMTGGGTGRCLTTTEAGGMGEGWSDTVAFWVETNSTTPVDFVLGAWVYNNPAGIRSVPYSTNKNTDPYTYATVATKNEVHDIGEVWATVLIEVYWALVAARGYSSNKTDPTGTAGNIAFLHLLVDALPIQPCNPTFLTSRNAIIQADVNRYSGANKCTLWKASDHAFAKRGLGPNAANYRDDTSVPSGC
ncbi:hypothetical protein FRB90_002689 [Tulasnella sp. 427]|nr:hypothetical protein FRB90_002689 [Tulasnella sp. 427]